MHCESKQDYLQIEVIYSNKGHVKKFAFNILQLLYGGKVQFQQAYVCLNGAIIASEARLLPFSQNKYPIMLKTIKTSNEM